MKMSEPVFQGMFEIGLDSPERFHLARLQLYNWGTYQGVQDFPIAKEGYMFVGPSGSGKSTALDAHATLLTPRKWLAFNVAAREDKRRADRNLVSYVRGAWGDLRNRESREIVLQFLRKGTAWSVIAATYRNANGRIVVLAQVLWIKGASSAVADLRTSYLVLEREFDVREMQPFAQSDFNVRQLKATLQGAKIKEDFSSYQELYRGLLGIANESALRLLHKTQSTKDLGDLDVFLRDFMLDVPETFVIADALVEQFKALNEAHRLVLEAERQIQTLVPARIAFDAHERVDADLNFLNETQVSIDAYEERLRSGLLDEAIQELTVHVDGSQQELAAAELDHADEQRKLQVLEASLGEGGGNRLNEIGLDIANNERLRADVQRRRGSVEEACAGLGWPVPVDAHWMASRAAEAATLIAAAKATRADIETRRDDAKAKKRDGAKRFSEVAAEIRAMEKQPSNIPSRFLEVRARLCAALEVDVSRLPFAGELLEVRPQEVAWQGAIERVLGGFAVSLLVDERLYREVSAWINDNHLNIRLAYNRVSVAVPAQHPLGPGSLILKLAFAKHPHAEWIRAELQKRFDYDCVASLEALRIATRPSVTSQGLVKHTLSRHEKNDRHHVDDQSQWVLGFDNRAKLALFKAQAQELAAEFTRIDATIASVDEERETLEVRLGHCARLVAVQWSDIDALRYIEAIDALRKEETALKASRPDLDRIASQIALQRLTMNKHALKRDQRRNVLGVDRAELDKLRSRRGQIRPERSELVLSPPVQSRLESLYAGTGKAITLDSLSEVTRKVEGQLNDERLKLVNEQRDARAVIERQFNAFIGAWQSESGGLDASLASASDFFAKLERLERDGLPQFKDRFRRLLHEQSDQNLMRLSSQLRSEKQMIKARLERVNASLKTAAYNPGTYLEIETEDRALTAVSEFESLLRASLAHSLGNDDVQAEARFGRLKELVDKLSDPDPRERRWRELALDVRLHVEFNARELDSAGVELEVYRGGAGKSGGQRQKLTLTCLAAALRYQLSGEDGEFPRYSTVVVDEAFDKADPEFTTMTMQIFKTFGFQMIVATPLKAVMTLDPFIGGACFVHSPDRQTSRKLLIEYDHTEKRLILSDEIRQADADADADTENA